MKRVVVLLILVIMLSGCSINTNTNNKIDFEKEYITELRELGYTEENINYFESHLEEDSINYLTEYDYVNDIVELLEAETFDESKLKDYLEYYDYTSNTNDILYLVNNNITYQYTEKLSNIINSKYFILKNIDRYMAYNSNDVETIIKYVNSNRDYDYYTNVKSSDTSKGILLITNKYYKLDNDYKSDSLVLLPSSVSNNNYSYMDSEAATHFKEMVEAGEENGVSFRALSAYRSYSSQNSIYNNYVANHGKDWADKWSAHPGHSEHQTGLAVDVTVKVKSNFDGFEKTKEYVWLKDNSYKYGFILRYTEDNKDITGYGAEAWHYRYVGIDAATYIYENNITFEEYYAYFVENKTS